MTNRCYQDKQYQYQLQETIRIQEGFKNLSRLKNALQNVKIKRLPYPNFFGIDENDLLEEINSHQEEGQSKDPFFPEADQKDLDKAALTIQKKYKQKKRKDNKPQKEPLVAGDKINKNQSNFLFFF